MVFSSSLNQAFSQTPESLSSQDYLALAREIAAEFAFTAIERDRTGGTPKQERDRLRESGLLNLVIPQDYGGAGMSWVATLRIVREIAKADSSLAHIFSYHHLGVIIPHLYGSEAQKQYYYSETVRQGWFWCNALNPRDLRLVLTAEGNHFRLNGTKSFCSGAKDSNILPTTAVCPGEDNFTIVVIPSDRAGITMQDDWDNMGQRQTDSGSVTFNNVLVHPAEVLTPANSVRPFNTIRACLAQLNLANIYLGTAQGALATAKAYTQTQTRPWFDSGVEKATQDPYLLHHYGEMWVGLSAAECLAEQAGRLLQAAWDKEWELTEEQRGECAVAIATAKVAATRASLEIANRMFEVMGARSTAAQYGFDRYWRNLRTFTLHDPVDYKLRDLGNWALNQQWPTPGFYS